MFFLAQRPFNLNFYFLLAEIDDTWNMKFYGRK
uniref:Uncharacterized protein n=1 Tax=Vitis vinifera TaxID=29760 RepID=F6HYR0_VITVI